MLVLLQRISLSVLKDMGWAIPLSLVIAFLAWFFGTVLGIGIFAYPFLIVWKWAYIAMAAMGVLYGVTSILLILGYGQVYSRKWRVSRAEVYDGLLCGLYEERGWHRWTADEFKRWHFARKAAKMIADAVMSKVGISAQ